MIRSTWTRLAAVVLAAAFTFAGCGDDGDASSDETPGGTIGVEDDLDGGDGTGSGDGETDDGGSGGEGDLDDGEGTGGVTDG
jgi:hypothetical protein